MRRLCFLMLFTSLAVAQTPQTPRQALLEIFKATSPQQIEKHTPEVLQQAMAKLPPDVRQRQQQSMMFLSMAMMMAGNAVQTFDAGPILAVIENRKDNSRVEITVARDDLTGDTDAMEFGIRSYKDGKENEMPLEFRVLVDMKMENNVWKLSRIGASAGVQLDDPNVADAIVKKILEQAKQGRAANGTSAVTGNPSATSAIATLRTLNTAELTYATTYSSVGYTCSFSDLGGSVSGKKADAHGAQLIHPSLENGTRNGYRFEISGCTGSSNYRILASPVEKGSFHQAYCTDQSGVIRTVQEANSAECWTAGSPVK